MLVEASRAFNSSRVGSPLGSAPAPRAVTTAANVTARHNRKMECCPNMTEIPRGSLFLRLDGDQPMFRLPLLIRILPVGRVEEEVIIRRSLLHILEMIVGRSPEEIRDGSLGQEFGSRVERLDRQDVVMVLAGGEGKVAVCLAKIGLEFHRGQEFWLRFGEFLLSHEALAQAVV